MTESYLQHHPLHNEQAGQSAEQLIDPVVAQQAGLGGLKRFIQRFRRGDEAETFQEPGAFTEPEEVSPAPVGVVNLTNAFAERLAPPASQEYQFLNSLLTETALDAQKLRIDDVIAASPDLTEYGSIYDAKLQNSRDWSAAYHGGDQVTARQLDVKAANLREAEQAFDITTVTRYGVLRTERSQVERNHTITLSSAEPAAADLLKLLDVPLKPRDETAPFAQYAENDGTTWQAVDKTTVEDYLQAIPFMPEARAEDGAVRIEPADGEPFDVPLSLIARATGFDSWQGRRDSSKGWSSEFGDGTMDSIDVIKHYAGLSTELPPVGEIRVFVQPDGKVFCDNGSGDSHRIAAALLRGDRTIKANRLDFVRVAENII